MEIELTSDQIEPWGLQIDFAKNRLDWCVVDVTTQQQADKKGVEVGWYVNYVKVDEEIIKLYLDTTKELKELFCGRNNIFFHYLVKLIK